MPEESEAAVHLYELMKAFEQEKKSMCQVQPPIKICHRNKAVLRARENH